jgi:hypothetical protein
MRGHPPSSEIRGLFRWKYSGGLIFLFYPLGFAMIGIGLAADRYQSSFRLAYLFFVLAYIWFVGWWLTSDPLERKRPRPSRRQKRQLEPVSYGRYRAWQWGPIGFGTVVLVVSLIYTSDIELGKELSLPESELLPAGEPDPPNMTQCLPPPNSFRIYAGNSLAYYTGAPPYRFISTNGSPRVSVEKKGRGLAISTDVYAEDGRTVLVHIDKNHFV